MKKPDNKSEISIQRTPQKAVLYARVSSKEQEKEGFSIPAQLKLLREYAKTLNLSLSKEFTDIETAKQAGRVSFGEMVAFLQSNEDIHILLVEKTDRLYRNIKDWVILDEANIEIHFVKENVVLSRDSLSSEKFMHGIKVLMAKNYIDNLSEETRKGMIEKAEQGIYPSFAPLGYMNVEQKGKKVIIADPDRAPLVIKLFEWYATGEYSLNQLTRKVKEEGLVYRKTGNDIGRSVIHRIITNPIYYGAFWWKGTLYEGLHEPLISKGLFDRVQEVRMTNGQSRSRPKRHEWAFAGLLSCGHCGCALTAERKKGKYTYYRCTGNKGKCPEKYVREEEVARQFGVALATIRLDAEVMEWMVKALKESNEDTLRYHGEQLARLQGEYKKVQKRLDAMYLDKLDGLISGEYFEEKSTDWSSVLINIRSQIITHEDARGSYCDDGVQLLELAQSAVFLYEKQSMDEKRRLLNFVCSNSIWKDGRLIPNYRKPFDLLVDGNETYRASIVEKGAKNVSFDIWLPGRDSNPRPSG